MLDLRIRGDAGEVRHEVLRTELIVRDTCGQHEQTEQQVRQLEEYR
jgi:hypothetical protein